MADGIILIGHGSRQEEANEEVREITRMVAERSQGNDCYETAFLTLTRPDLLEASEKLIEQGVDRIIVAPIFLVTGSHIVQDIPAIIEDLKSLYPQVRFYMAGHIGAHPGIAEILLERIQECMDQI